MSRVHQEVIIRIESFIVRSRESQCRRCILKHQLIEVQDPGKERGQAQEQETTGMNRMGGLIQDLGQTHQEMISALCSHNLEEME